MTIVTIWVSTLVTYRYFISTTSHHYEFKNQSKCKNTYQKASARWLAMKVMGLIIDVSMLASHCQGHESDHKVSASKIINR